MRIALGGLAALGLALLFQPNGAKAAACAAGCVQTNNGSAFSGTSFGVNLTGVVAGHSIRVWYSLQANTDSVSSIVCGSVTASLGATTATVASGGKIGVALAANVGSGSITCTLTQPGTGITNTTMILEEWADPTTTAFDGQNATATAGSTSTPLPCGSISPATSDTIEAAMFQYQNVAPTAPAGYTFAQSGLTGSTFFFSAFKTSAATGAQNPTFTSGASSFNNGVVCAAFTQGGGGGGGTGGPSLLLMGIGQ